MLDATCQDFDISDILEYDPDTMKLSKIDRDIAKFYADWLLSPVKYGESGVFFWFPGSGMTTVTKDILASKELLKTSLEGLSKRLKIMQFWGNVVDKKTVSSLLKSAGVESSSRLKNLSAETLKKGDEIVIVVGGIDSFPKAELDSLFTLLLSLQSYNRRRVHIILNLQNKPLFEEIIIIKPELASIANSIKIMPVISGKLLESYIKQRAKEFGRSLSDTNIADISKIYGGVLQLCKEYIRSNGDNSSLELKLRLIWERLPNKYKNRLGNIPAKTNDSISEDLKRFGVAELEFVSKHQTAINLDPTFLLQKYLTPEEFKLWNYCRKSSGKFITKDDAIRILRPKNQETVSLWALDKAMSRFRKKLTKAGIDPESFKTIKGRGYKWTLI